MPYVIDYPERPDTRENNAEFFQQFSTHSLFRTFPRLDTTPGRPVQDDSGVGIANLGNQKSIPSPEHAEGSLPHCCCCCCCCCCSP